MISVKGIGIGKGMAKGRIYRMQNKDTADVYQKETPPKEKEKLRKAKEQSAEELRALYRKTLSISKESADIFDIHLMMLDDEDFCDYIDRKIEEGKSAPEAV